jgi:MFS family permease
MLRLRPAGSGWVAVLLAGELIPVVLLAPLVGRLVDRLETRRVLLVSLLGQAVVAVPLALVSLPWLTVVLFTGLNALGAFVRPATAALVPAIAAHDISAARAYSLIATGTSLGWIAGPAGGGLLTAAAGARAALLVDAATFAVLALATAGVRTRRPPIQHAVGAPRTETWAGFRVLANDPVLRLALLISALAIGCAVIDNVAAPFRFINQLGASASGYGLYLTLWGVGALAGAQLVPLFGERRAEAALAVGNALCGLGIAGIGFAPTLVVAFILSVLGGLGNGMTNVAQNALINQRTPADQAGRTFAAAAALVQLAVGLGTAGGSPLVVLLHPNGALVTAGSVALVPALFALVVALRRRPASPVTASTRPEPASPTP